MKVYLTTLTLALLISACDEKPQWSTIDASLLETNICFIASVGEYQLLVTPLSALRPVKRILTPWPENPIWATPVEWQVDRVILAAPLPGQTLTPIGSRLTALWANPFSDFGIQQTLTIHQIDGEWVVSLPMETQFKSTPNGWRRTAAEYSWSTETFATVQDLTNKFQSDAKRSECGRSDWVDETRRGAQERARQANNPSPVTPIRNDAGP